MPLPCTLRWLAFLAFWLAALVPGVCAQKPEAHELFTSLIAEGEREQIPWSVSLAAPQLRLDQRLGAEVKVSLNHDDLKRHGEKHDLLVMARVAQPGAAWLPGIEWLALPVDKPLANNTTLEFQFYFLARPGDFRVGIVLLDQVSGDSNATIRPLRVEPLRDDPLPQAFRDLPPAEFLTATQGFEAALLTRMKGRLWLPVESPRKLRLEVLANFSPSEEFRVHRSDPWPFRFSRRRRRVPSAEDHLLVTLAALKPLAELHSPDGLRITGLDLIRRRVIFEQPPLATPDWQRLREGLGGIQSNVVSADTLLAQKESAEFLRQVLRERLQVSPAPVAPPAKPPLRVIILLSTAMVFPSGADLSPIEKAPSCNCRVYFLRMRPFGNYWDHLDSILRPLQPRRFDVRTPADYRRALAAILADLREL